MKGLDGGGGGGGSTKVGTMLVAVEDRSGWMVAPTKAMAGLRCCWHASDSSTCIASPSSCKCNPALWLLCFWCSEKLLNCIAQLRPFGDGVDLVAYVDLRYMWLL